MRLKILKENFCHNKLVSSLIILCCICITIVGILSFEISNFLVFANIEKTQYTYNDYDIKIEANVPLSTVGIKTYINDNNETLDLTTYYDQVISFYKTTHVVTNNDISDIVEIIEADYEDYKNGFNLPTIPLKNEAIITKEVATSLNLEENGYLNIYVNDSIYEYKIIKIIDSDRLYEGKHILIGGRNITYKLGMDKVKLQNNILINLKTEKNAQKITDMLNKNYSVHNVTNLLDVETAKQQTINTISTICLIVVIVFVFVLLMLCNIYSYRMKKQKYIFELNHQIKYYNQVHFIEWSILYITSLIIGSISTHYIFKLFYPIFNCVDIFKTNVVNNILSSLIIFVVPVFFLIKKKKIHIKFIYKYLTLGILATGLIIAILIVNNSSYQDLFLILLTIILIFILVDIAIWLTKYIKPFIIRSYLYNINKDNKLFKFSILMQITFLAIISLIVTSIAEYKSSLDHFWLFDNVETVVVTPSKSTITKNYNHIKLINDYVLENNKIKTIVSMNSNQIKNYTNLNLTQEELRSFDNGKKMLLSDYYYNIAGYEIGDLVTLQIGEHEETFEIMKFIDKATAYEIFVSNSEYLYDAYIMDQAVQKDKIISDFKNSNYYIVDVETMMEPILEIHRQLIQVIIIILIMMVVILISFSMYISYLEIEYQKDIIQKFKLLGVDKTLFLKMTLLKTVIVVVICLVCGIAFNYFFLNKIDNILRLVKTILRVKFVYKYVFISASIVFVNTFISLLFNNIKFKKYNAC